MAIRIVSSEQTERGACQVPAFGGQAYLLPLLLFPSSWLGTVVTSFKHTDQDSAPEDAEATRYKGPVSLNDHREQGCPTDLDCSPQKG